MDFLFGPTCFFPINRPQRTAFHRFCDARDARRWASRWNRHMARSTLLLFLRVNMTRRTRRTYPQSQANNIYSKHGTNFFPPVSRPLRSFSYFHFAVPPTFGDVFLGKSGIWSVEIKIPINSGFPGEKSLFFLINSFTIEKTSFFLINLLPTLSLIE